MRRRYMRRPASRALQEGALVLAGEAAILRRRLSLGGRDADWKNRYEHLLRPDILRIHPRHRRSRRRYRDQQHRLDHQFLPVIGLGMVGQDHAGLAATRALENGVFLGMANRVGREAGFDSLGWSCIVAPSGMFLGALKDEPGIVTATFALQSEDLEKWRAIATNREDRRPDLYRS